MLKTLRSRLLLSYFIVILMVLCVVGLALLALSANSNARYLPVLERLQAVSQASRSELLRLREPAESGRDSLLQITAVLSDTAASTGVRVLLVSGGRQQVAFDSATTDNLQGRTLNEIDRNQVQGVLGPNSNRAYGRFLQPGGGTWLFYSPDLPLAMRSQLFYAVPEPTPFAFFNEFFLGPLCVAGFLAFLLAVLLALWIARSVSRPLRHIATAAEAIAAGEYEQQVALQGPEEMRRAASSFNFMSVQVKTTQQSQRDFVANISHDLKTPLTAIQGWSQSLLDGTAVSPDVQERAAGIIHSEAMRMGRLVNQLLDLARIESGQMELAKEPVDLGQLVTDLYHSIRLRAEEHQLHLTLDVQPVPAVAGDPDRLMQVLTNLAENALTHTANGGRVHLAVQPHGPQAVDVVVQDTGQGIPQEDLTRIFERFYQVDKSRVRTGRQPGSGLGLAIVTELVAAHNGRVFANSQLGQGTAFTVRLPVSDTPEGTTVISQREA